MCYTRVASLYPPRAAALPWGSQNWLWIFLIQTLTLEMGAQDQGLIQDIPAQSSRAGQDVGPTGRVTSASPLQTNTRISLAPVIMPADLRRGLPKGLSGRNSFPRLQALLGETQ